MDRVPLWKRPQRSTNSLRRIEQWAKTILSHSLVAGSFVAFAWVACIFFGFYPQFPGMAVAVLGTVAAVVTFADMHSTHKLLATVAIFVLMGLEIRDIRKDRAASDSQAAEQRRLDRESFKKIATGLDSSIQQSQSHFEATMNQVKPTLEASRKAVENTIPQALMIAQRVNLGSKTPPQPTPGSPMSFNIYFTNSGNDTARLFRRDGRAYLAVPGDTQQQREIWDAFDSTWRKEEDFKAVPFEIDPNSTGDSFFSILTNELSVTDVSNFNSRALAVYVLVRFVYSDRTGRWASDSCRYYQDFTRDGVSHPCEFKKSRKYRATWQ